MKRIIISQHKGYRNHGSYYIMECIICHKHFKIIGTTIKLPGEGGKYCSMKCRNIATKREGNPHWKGGKITYQGYVMIRRDRMTKKGNKYQFEHRLIMEQYLGRYLKPEEIVHHINGIRNDNRVENLVLTTKSKHQHYTLVKQLQEKIRVLESKLAELTGGSGTRGN